MKKNLNYVVALEAMQSGKRVVREAWNAKKAFIFERQGDTLEKEFIPKVKSLPETVKEALATEDRDIVFLPYLCLFTESGEVFNGWAPSDTDRGAQDWCILD